MRFWTIYAWVFSGLLLLSAAGRAFLYCKRHELVSKLDLAEAAAGVIAIPALLGFAYRHAYGYRWMWEIMSVLLIGLSLYHYFTPKMKKLYQRGFVTAAGVILLEFIFGAPAMWALICYAFYDKRIW